MCLSARTLWVGLLMLLGLTWSCVVSATDEMAMIRWFDSLNQRWLLSQEIAAYQYRHALDPPVMLQPLMAPLLTYAKYLGLDEALARRFLQEERAVDQRLQQRWLRKWQQTEFPFDTEDFLDAPELCRKQERLERDMLRQLLRLQAGFSSAHEKARFAMILEQQLMVPALTADDRTHFLNALFPRV